MAQAQECLKADYSTCSAEFSGYITRLYYFIPVMKKKEIPRPERKKPPIQWVTGSSLRSKASKI
jgi:hypothetical protein